VINTLALPAETRFAPSISNLPCSIRKGWMSLRFKANFSDPSLNLDPFIDEVFGELKSGFLELPKGQGPVRCFQTGSRDTDRHRSEGAHQLALAMAVPMTRPQPIRRLRRFRQAEAVHNGPAQARRRVPLPGVLR
jgi:hypothetical protein